MKLLLDENLPKKLKADFKGHQVFTLLEKGWLGIKNGQLLKLILAKGFNALLTFDKICATSKTSKSIRLPFLFFLLL